MKKIESREPKNGDTTVIVFLLQVWDLELMFAKMPSPKRQTYAINPLQWKETQINIWAKDIDNMGTYSLSNVQLLEPICLFIMVGRYLELSINLSKGISIKSFMADWLRKSFVLTLSLRDQFIFHLVRHISEEGPLLLTVHMPSFNLIIAAGVLQIIFRKYLSWETLHWRLSKGPLMLDRRE